MKIQSENFIPNGSLKYNLQRVTYNYVPHLHQFAELGYVIDGEIDVTVDGVTYSAQNGDFVFLYPMQLHSYRTPVSTDYFVCAFSGMLIRDYLTMFKGKRGISPVFHGAESVRQYFYTTFVDGELDNWMGLQPHPLPEAVETHIVDYSDPDKLFRIQSCLYAILGEYCRTTEAVEIKGDTDAFSHVMSYLAEHFREPVTLTSTASASGYSAGYLSHIIKKTCGMNFSELLGNLRVEYALSRMKSSDDTLLDISLDSGFGTERSFYRMFRRIMGCTPGEYLK